VISVYAFVSVYAHVYLKNHMSELQQIFSDRGSLVWWRRLQYVVYFRFLGWHHAGDVTLPFRSPAYVTQTRVVFTDPVKRATWSTVPNMSGLSLTNSLSTSNDLYASVYARPDHVILTSLCSVHGDSDGSCTPCARHGKIKYRHLYGPVFPQQINLPLI